MDRNAIKREAAAGTALYYSKSNGWAEFSEYHGKRVVVTDAVPGHWMYNRETNSYEKKASASTLYRSRTTLGYLVREVDEDGSEFIAHAGHLRGAWTACQDIVKANQRTKDKFKQIRDERIARNEQMREELLMEFGLHVESWSANDATGSVTVDTKRLLELLRSVRAAA